MNYAQIKSNSRKRILHSTFYNFMQSVPLLLWDELTLSFIFEENGYVLACA